MDKPLDICYDMTIKDIIKERTRPLRLFSSKSIYTSDAARAEYERETGGAVTASPPKGRLHLRPLDWLILGLIAAVLCLLMFGGAYLVSNRTTIFPGVHVNGTRLAGLETAQATAVTKLAGWDGSDRTVLTVLLPGENSMTVRSGVAGWSQSARAAAEMAMDYGRQSGMIGNFFAYLRSYLFGYNIADALGDEIDADTLRTQVNDTVRQVNLDLSGGNLELDEEAQILRVTKGAELLLADPERVYQETLFALESHQDVADCVPKPDSDAETKEMDLQQLHDQICGDPVNAYFDMETMEIAEARSGVQFDAAEAQRLWDDAGAGDVVEIPCVVTPAAFQKDDASLYRDLLAIKSTPLGGSSWNRVNNVTLAASKIHDVILYPGQSFSYNETVGQRTWDAGFREAGAYANGEVVQEVGGGICQVSSTLYWCAMKANLKILERTNHMFPVSYIEPGMDATVSWGAPDFRFENNRTFPVAIVAFVQNGMLTVQLWGTNVDGSYANVDYYRNGNTVTTYRHVYDAWGNELSSELEAVSIYHSH